MYVFYLTAQVVIDLTDEDVPVPKKQKIIEVNVVDEDSPDINKKQKSNEDNTKLDMKMTSKKNYQEEAI